MKQTKKAINKFCKSLDERRFYTTYGKVFIIDLLKIVFLVGFITPLIDYLIMYLIKKYNLNVEFMRITIKK